jgi:hypothetical protein
MNCRHCGTEIADKALICYRCGTATKEPAFRPTATGRRRSSSNTVASVLALILLVLLALYMGRMNAGQVPRIAIWIAVAIAVSLVALRAWTRRH